MCGMNHPDRSVARSQRNQESKENKNAKITVKESQSRSQGNQNVEDLMIRICQD